MLLQVSNMNEEPSSASYDGPQGILVVDDDERVLKFLSRMLYSFGHDEVYVAASGRDALQIWKAKRDKIWLLISDFVMPKLTGDLLALELQKDRPDLKVFFISGNTPESLSSQIPLRSGHNFLQKPFNMADLRACLKRLAPAEDEV